MLTAEQLAAMQRVDITRVDPAALVDIQSVRVDADAPLPARLRSFVEQIGNPYAFRVGDTPVKLQYGSSGLLLRDAFIGYLRALRAGS